MYALGNIIIAPLATGGPLDGDKVLLFVQESIAFFVLTHLYRMLIKKWGWLQIGFVLVVPRFLASTVVLGAVIYIIRIFGSKFLGIYDVSLISTGSAIGLISANFLIIFSWSLLYFSYHYFDRYNLSLKYEASMNEMELNQLKSQLNPHFIFNALNSIRALIDENPAKSKDAITHLSSILRSSLVLDKSRLTNFEDELKTVKDYLSLEKIRFEERLNMEFDIHPESWKFMVPPLMIQTLVENGIKHGVSKLKEGGTIKLKTFVEESQLMIQIRNSGHYTKQTNRKSGFGIRNTKQRLKLIYGDVATFTIFNESDNVVLTTIKVPQSI